MEFSQNPGCGSGFHYYVKRPAVLKLLAECHGCKEEDMNHFGAFLVQRGLVSTEHVLTALDIQREQQIPIGKIALEHRLLRMDQVFEILNRQGDVNLKFGDIALDLGFLTRQQVDFLLAIQKGKRPPMGKILLEMGVLSRQQLAEALDAYEQSKFSAGSEPPPGS
jgi:hypothetical protein